MTICLSPRSALLAGVFIGALTVAASAQQTTPPAAGAAPALPPVAAQLAVEYPAQSTTCTVYVMGVFVPPIVTM